MIISSAKTQLRPCWPAATYMQQDLHLSLVVVAAVGFVLATMKAQCEQPTSLLSFMLIPIVRCAP
jgi:hypothetical protein